MIRCRTLQSACEGALCPVERALRAEDIPRTLKAAALEDQECLQLGQPIGSAAMQARAEAHFRFGRHGESTATTSPFKSVTELPANATALNVSKTLLRHGDHCLHQCSCDLSEAVDSSNGRVARTRSPSQEFPTVDSNVLIPFSAPLCLTM